MALKASQEASKQKLVFNPTRLRAFSCPLRYHIRYVQKRTAKAEVVFKRELGSLIHATHEAFEKNLNVDEVLRLKLNEMKRQDDFTTKMLPLMERLKKDALTIFYGGTVRDAKGNLQKVQSYEAWRAQHWKNWEVREIEQRHFVDLGPVIVAPKNDLVMIDEDDKVWLVEIKTGERAPSNVETWRRQWKLDHQTTINVLALEQAYDQKIAGVLMIPIFYGRQTVKGWDKPYPQQLNRVSRFDPIKISKSPETKALYMERLEELPREVECYKDSNIWPARGMENGLCTFCEFRSVCAGEQSPRQLVKAVPDDIDRFMELRVEKQLQILKARWERSNKDRREDRFKSRRKK